MWPCVVVFCLLCSCVVGFQTRAGAVRGSVCRSRAGRPYSSYLAVPYALPPVGALRLRNPKPHHGWEGELDATEEAAPCTQIDFFTPRARNITTGQEDCLYLNIFMPQTENNEKLPVMVHIHGGGFRRGNPGPKESAAYFMDEDVILVTIQYRLGVLGFLSTEDSIIPGNFGLKDQAMALSWLKENIDDYGGDPDSIVVFGESAGGASVHYHLTSPVSRELIKGGISQSGSIDAPWAFAPPGRAKKYARKVARIVNCASSPLLECFQSLTAEQLIEAERELIEWDFDPAVIFQPVIEEKSEGAFITVDPRTVKVTLPWVTGLTNGEGNFRSAGLINQDPSVLDYFVENIDQVLPALLFVEPKVPGIEKFLISVKNRYFRNLDERKHLLKEHEKLFFDLCIAYPMIKALERHAGPKYAYFLSHRAANSLADLMGPIKLNSSKASHIDELISLFDLSSYFPGSKTRPEDTEFSKRLVKLWVSFAKSLSNHDADFEKHWKRYSKNYMLHLKTEESKMEQISLDYVADFWSKAYDLLKPVTIKDEF